MNNLVNIIIDPNDDDVDCRFHYAALCGDVEKLKCLVAEVKADDSRNFNDVINVRIRPLGATPLRLAVTGGHLDAAEYLLNQGSNIDQTDLKGQTPLFVSIRNNYLECAELLLQRGANVNGDEDNMCTPLQVATQNGCVRSVQLLLRFGADIEIRSKYSNTGTRSFEGQGFLSEIWQRHCGDSTQPVTPIQNPSMIGLPLRTAISCKFFDIFLLLLVSGAEADLRLIHPPLSVRLLAQLSLTHAMVHHEVPEEFVRAFVEFGGYLWQRGLNMLPATEKVLSPRCRDFLLKAMEQPLTLQSICRIRIRRLTGRGRLHQLDHLPLPKILIDILMYRDLLPKKLSDIFY